jgi:hypothetical protein
MELSDPRLIASLLVETRTRRPRLPRGGQAVGNRLFTPKRCICGQCFTCRDNAKWNRIFNEKFADPDYYSRSGLSQGSSLSDLG